MRSVSSPGSVESSDSDVANRLDFSVYRELSRSKAMPFESDEDEDFLPMESQDATFIQPEGDVGHLPSDIDDETASLQYNELGPFFDSRADELEFQKIPEARRIVIELERRWKAAAPSREERNRILSEWCVFDRDFHQLNIRCSLAILNLFSVRIFTSI
jgi:hypothetical protein